VFFLFDLLHFGGENLMPAPLIERKERLQAVLANDTDAGLQYSAHIIGQGPAFLRRGDGRDFALAMKRRTAENSPQTLN
jgi:ATP-dependent DNA ligase